MDEDAPITRANAPPSYEEVGIALLLYSLVATLSRIFFLRFITIGAVRENGHLELIPYVVALESILGYGCEMAQFVKITLILI